MEGPTQKSFNDLGLSSFTEYYLEEVFEAWTRGMSPCITLSGPAYMHTYNLVMLNAVFYHYCLVRIKILVLSAKSRKSKWHIQIFINNKVTSISHLYARLYRCTYIGKNECKFLRRSVNYYNDMDLFIYKPLLLSCLR